jgi:hypothetical protein
MPKFNLRDLFAVVTLAAVLVAWALDHAHCSRLQVENQHLQLQVETLTAKLKQHGITANAR